MVNYRAPLWLDGQSSDTVLGVCRRHQARVKIGSSGPGDVVYRLVPPSPTWNDAVTAASNWSRPCNGSANRSGVLSPGAGALVSRHPSPRKKVRINPGRFIWPIFGAGH
jgi:hypothetical protein